MGTRRKQCYSSIGLAVFGYALVLIPCILFFSCDLDKDKGSTPASPSYVNVTSNTEGVVRISWSYVSSAYKYVVECKKSGDFPTCFEYDFLTTGAILTDLDQGASYTIYVYALGANNERSTPAKTTVTVSTKKPSPDRLPPIIGFKVASNSHGTVSLQWLPVTGAKAYFAEYKQSNSNTWHGDREYSSSTATISGLTAKASYDFRVRAYADSDRYYAIYNDYVYLYGVIVNAR